MSSPEGGPRPGTSASRRSVLAAGAGGTLAAVLGAVAAPGAAAAPGSESASTRRAEAATRPNIVWFIADDPSPYLGAYGDTAARTPTIDALAADGIVFDAAYCAAPVCAPSRFALLTGMYPTSAGPAYHMRASAELPADVKGFPEHLRGAGYYTTNNSKTDYNAEVDLAATWDDSSATAHWRNRPAGAPFFAQFTSMTTHESQLFGAPDGATSPEDVTVPEYLPDTPTTRRDLAHYHDRIAQMDTELAELLAQLEADGLAEDTIVFFLADNGGALPFSKRYATEHGLRIPLIVKVPPAWEHLAPQRPGSRVAAPVHGVDLPLTALTVAQVDPPAQMKGWALLGEDVEWRQYTWGHRDRMDERYDMQRSARDERYLYVRNYMPHRPYGQHNNFMWQLPSYQEWEQLHLDGELDAVHDRFWGEKPAEELYDLDRDPEAVDNLIASDREQLVKVRRRMRRALDRHMLRTNDNGFIPEGHPLEGYEASRRRGAYPLRAAIEVAGLSIRRDRRNLERLQDEMDADHDVIRFWAAQGLLMLGDDAAPATSTLEASLQDDPSVHVRIPVAEALARLGHVDDAVPFLGRTVDEQPDVRIKLQALNALTWVGDAAAAQLDVVDRAAASADEYVANAARYLRAVLTGTYSPSASLVGT